MAAPTLTSYAQSTWSDTPSLPATETTASLSWNSGDTIYVLGMTEDSSKTFGTPTATGLSFSLVTSLTTGSNTTAYLWTATAGSTSSGTISATLSGSATGAGGLSAFAYNGQGLGNTGTINGTAAKTISLTRSAANSAVIVGLADWNQVGDVTVTGDPSTGSTQRVAQPVSGRADFFVYSWTDQGATGTTSYGIGSHTGTVDMTGIVAEVKGTASSSVTITPGGGSVVLTGAAPTVTGGTQVIRPAGGSVVLSGGVPTITGGTMLIRPGGGSVVLSGAAPTVTRTENQSITPAGGSVVLSGAAPTVSKTENHFITPAGGSVVLTGAAPTVSDSGATSFTITPDAGILVLTGAAPTITVSDHRTITPDGGSVVLNGAAPTLTISGPILITPDAGQIILTGFAPIVSNSGDVVSAGQQPAGRSKRKYPKRRVTVEIDGESFTVSSEQEAVALLEQAREVAEQQAREKAQEIVRKRKTASRRDKKPLKLAPIALEVPTVKTSDSAEAQEFASTLRDELDEIYRQAALDAELSLHMHYQRVLDEEDDVMLLLIGTLW